PVQNGFRAGRAAWNVSVYRNDIVDPLDGCVVVVEPSGARTDPERNHPFGFAHLFVHAVEDRSDLVTDGSHHKENIGLSWRKARQSCSKAVHIVVPCRGRHVLHAAAGCYERILEDGILPRPSDGTL